MIGPMEATWLLEDLVPVGALVVLHGKTKSGEPIFALNLALAQAISRPFLRRRSLGAQVALIRPEEAPTIIRNRVKTMCDFVPEGVYISAGIL